MIASSLSAIVSKGTPSLQPVRTKIDGTSAALAAPESFPESPIIRASFLETFRRLIAISTGSLAGFGLAPNLLLPLRQKILDAAAIQSLYTHIVWFVGNNCQLQSCVLQEFESLFCSGKQSTFVIISFFNMLPETRHC